MSADSDAIIELLERISKTFYRVGMYSDLLEKQATPKTPTNDMIAERLRTLVAHLLVKLLSSLATAKKVMDQSRLSTFPHEYVRNCHNMLD